MYYYLINIYCFPTNKKQSISKDIAEERSVSEYSKFNLFNNGTNAQ